MEKIIVPNLYIIKNADTKETLFTEYAENKAFYSVKDENGNNVNKDIIVYPFIDSLSDLYSVIVSTTAKTCIRYSGENDIIRNIGRECKAINGRINHFVEFKDDETRDEYTERIISEYSHDTRDIISHLKTELLISAYTDEIPEQIYIENIDSVIEFTYSFLNSFIYGEKKTYNERGTYNNLIQDSSGNIVKDTLRETKAMNRAVKAYEDEENEIIRIISLAIQKKGYTETELNIIRLRIFGKKYKEIASEYNVSIRKIQAIMETFRNAIKKQVKKNDSEILKAMRKIYRYTATDKDGNTITDESGKEVQYNRLMRV